MLLSMVVVALATGPGHCPKTFNAFMIKRAVDAEYHAARDVTTQDRKDVERFIRCARPKVDRHAMRQYRRSMRQAWYQRRLDSQMAGAVASWYDLGGNGACGIAAQAGLRLASLILPCGAWIRICHGSRCADAQMADHGPYIAGRTFDLNANLRDALRCGGICYVRWRRLG